MKATSLIFGILLILGIIQVSLGQTTHQYVIFSFEQTHKVSQHGLKEYFWILPVDSLKGYDSQLYPLFLKGISTDNIVDCCAGKEIDPFLVFENTDFYLDSINSAVISNLINTLRKNSRKVQTIRKVWSSGQKESIRIFATPVAGHFCFSQFHPIGQQRTGYKGVISVPSSLASIIPEFWDTTKSKLILNSDYSKIAFNIIQ